jgi:hypothetical protein
VPTAKYTVIYETGQSRHKLLKLMLTDDGSYYATCPYHQSEKVELTKRVINFANPSSRAGEPPIELAVLEDDEHRLKLSHHPDGFVQFSGHGIRSGRNADGSPKGMGFVSFPLDRPTAGPAFGLSVMTPTAFKPARAPAKSDITFSREEMFAADEDNGLVIEAFYFTARWRRFVKLRNGAPMILLRHPSGALLELKVCAPPNNDWRTGFLGVDLWPSPIKLGGESGFAMSSPTGELHYNHKDELEAAALFACYPPIGNDGGPTPAPMALMFPPRDDPAYVKGASGPTEDVQTRATRLAPRLVRKPPKRRRRRG